MNDDDLDFLKTLQLEFIGETTDSLNLCEGCLIQYEKQKSPDHIRELLRNLHSMKGSARAVEFEKFAMTIHKVESLGSNLDDPNFVEYSLFAIDKLRDALSCIKSNDLDKMDLVLDEIMNKIS